MKQEGRYGNLTSYTLYVNDQFNVLHAMCKWYWFIEWLGYTQTITFDTVANWLILFLHKNNKTLMKTFLSVNTFYNAPAKGTYGLDYINIQWDERYVRRVSMFLYLRYNGSCCRREIYYGLWLVSWCWFPLSYIINKRRRENPCFWLRDEILSINKEYS